MASRSRRLGEGRSAGRAPSVDSNMSSVHVSGVRKRQSGTNIAIGSGSRRDPSVSDSAGVVHSRRPTRGPKKRYVESESSEEEDEVVVDGGGGGDDDEDDEDEEDEDDSDGDEEEEEEQDVIKVGDSDVDMGDEDAEGDPEDMDVDAEGDEDMDAPTVSAILPPSIRISRPAGDRTATVPKARGRRLGGVSHKADMDEDEDDMASVEVAGDEEDAEGETELGVVDDEEDDDEIDAEGEEIEVMEEDDEENDGEGDGGAGGSEGELGSREGTPDLTKMTRRQRARFEETPQEYMKLSDEVQVKKHFTAEELSMRRAEMARRRRNLSEKRNEEVKAETINKLLKRQAPKTTKKNALGYDSGDEEGGPRGDPTIVRWVSNSKGSRLAVSAELLGGPVGAVLRGPGGVRKMVEEVS